MPSNNFKSPYATSFNSAVKRGTPCFVAVQSIAKRCGKSPKQVFESLYKGGCCYRQKFNGQWIYWPCNGTKTNATNCKVAQWNCWQNFVDWCICSGHCTPEQMWKNNGSQNSFMNWCKKFWGKQYNSTTVTKTGRKTSTRNYKFSGARTTRRAA